MRASIAICAGALALAAPAWADDPPPPDPASAPVPAADPAPFDGGPNPRTPPLAKQIEALEARIGELEAANEAAIAAAAEDKEPPFRIYGFIDMGLQKLWGPDDPVIPTRQTTFVLGNINLYFDFHPTSDWSSLVEVRLTNYPSGTETAGVPLAGVPYLRTNTLAQDPGNGEGYDTVKWGAIVLERAYIQWQHTSALGVRAGQFLTPYGIWNVDHGTPTLIALFRPTFESNQLFPSHQLGVEVFGRFDHLLPDRWALEYHAYVSNGRTPGVVDLDSDKMVGIRIAATTLRPKPMKFGLSAMRGRNTDEQRQIDALTGETMRVTTVDEHEYAVALDASIDLGAVRFRAEAALNHREYALDKRELSWLPGVYVADGNQTDVYVLGSYRIPHTRFEPFAYGEIYHWPTPLGENLVSGSIGLTTYFTPAIQLKAQYEHSTWTGGRDPTFSKATAGEDFVAAKLVMGL